jgi:acetamidase/formamidase
MKAKQTVFVDQFTNGVLDPNLEFEYMVKDGGHIVANTAPGCWGPMMTPELKGGHEVTKPVYVENAEVGDAIAIYIEDIHVTSMATASGSDKPNEDSFGDDPFIDGTCPHCGTLNPETEIRGIGKDSIYCKNCGKQFTPFTIDHGYTIAFDEHLQMGITLDEKNAYKLAENANECANMPENSIQNSILSQAPTDLVGVVARMRPFLGQLGTTPSQAFPDSHNAGDFAQSLIGASHEFKKSEEELEHRTDGHMDVNKVRQGAVLVAPVKVKGGGVYLGDLHAMQGNGEIAGHTTDVAGIVRLRVEVIKEAHLEGPILFPVPKDLPYLAQPFSKEEKEQMKQLAKKWEGVEPEESLPITFIGTGASLNEAADNGLNRAARLFEVPLGEILNRSTITGSIDIGRNPGVVTVTFLAPKSYLEKIGLLKIAEKQYE